MTIHKQILSLALVASAAFAAVPSTMLFQGSMSQDGTPVSGRHKLVVQLCTSSSVNISSGCQTVFSDSASFTQGYYSVALTSLPSFDQQWYMDVTMDNVPPLVRTALTSAPSALNAAVATRANSATLADSTTGGAKRAATAQTAQSLTGDPVLRLDPETRIEIPTTGAYLVSRTAPVTDGNRNEAFVRVWGTGTTVELQATDFTNGVKTSTSQLLMSNSSTNLTTPATSISGTLTVNGTVTLGSLLKLTPVLAANVPVCSVNLRGSVLLVNMDRSGPGAYAFDNLLVCQYYSNPGGTGYRWLKIPMDIW
jgi:hypothetical protein